jgi:hypothetical protein
MLSDGFSRPDCQVLAQTCQTCNLSDADSDVRKIAGQLPAHCQENTAPIGIQAMGE